MIDYDYVRASLKSQENCNNHFLERYIKTVRHWENIKEEIPPESYPQQHHIVPRWMGGEDSSRNLVKVPVRIHLYLHKLLFQVTRSRQALCSVMVFSKRSEVENTRKAESIFMNVKSYLMTIVYEDYIQTQQSLTKGTLWMTNGEKDTRVSPEDAPMMLADGWDFGRSNKAIKDKMMTFDTVEQKWVKIDIDDAKGDPERYQCGVIRCWDSSDQPDFPYIRMTGVRREEFDNNENFRCPSETVRLEDGRIIHKDYFTEDMVRWKEKRSTPNHRWKGIYHTPYGDFVNIWTFERETSLPHSRAENWCRNCDKIISTKSNLYDKDHPNRSYRDLGWSFTPREDVTDEMLDNVIGLYR